MLALSSGLMKWVTTRLIARRTLARPRRRETRPRLISSRHRALLRDWERCSFVVVVVVVVVHIIFGSYEQWVQHPTLATIRPNAAFKLVSRGQMSNQSCSCTRSYNEKVMENLSGPTLKSYHPQGRLPQRGPKKTLTG